MDHRNSPALESLAATALGLGSSERGLRIGHAADRVISDLLAQTDLQPTGGLNVSVPVSRERLAGIAANTFLLVELCEVMIHEVNRMGITDIIRIAKKIEANDRAEIEVFDQGKELREKLARTILDLLKPDTRRAKIAAGLMLFDAGEALQVEVDTIEPQEFLELATRVDNSTSIDEPTPPKPREVTPGDLTQTALLLRSLSLSFSRTTRQDSIELEPNEWYELWQLTKSVCSQAAELTSAMDTIDLLYGDYPDFESILKTISSVKEVLKGAYEGEAAYTQALIAAIVHLSKGEPTENTKELAHKLAKAELVKSLD